MLAAVSVITQEQYDVLSQRFGEQLIPFIRRTIGSRIGIIIIDKVHTILVGRCAIQLAIQRTRSEKLAIIGLTGTLPRNFTYQTGLQSEIINEQQKSPRIIFTIPSYPSQTDVLKLVRELGWLADIQAIASDKIKRTALFIENKTYLKIVLFSLVSYIRTNIMDHQLPETRDPPEIMVGINRDLQTANATDPAICADVTPYGLSLSSSREIIVNRSVSEKGIKKQLGLCCVF
jgi:hypothetical protein